ncbi:MAG: membrane protein [Pseudohongiella sp.]|nr:MAG: membrane protein [Pseudohongiella sp.]
MHNPTIRHAAGFFLSLIAAMLWGMLPVALKELLEGMDAISIVWYRFFVAGVVLFAWLAFQRKLPSLLRQSGQIKWFLLFAAIGLCINYFLFSYSLNFINGETTEVVIQLTTLFLILGGVFVYKEPFFGVQKFGTLLIMLGLLLFFHDRLGELFSLENSESIGVIFVVFAAITWTVYALLQKQLLNSFSSVQILFLIYAFSSVVLLPLISPLSLFQLSELQFYLLVFCCLNTIVAYGCFAEALNCWDASKVSAVLALAPLFTIGSLKLVVFFQPDYAFSDRLGLLSLLGALLLVVGSVLTALMPVFQQHRARRRASLIEPV